VVLPDGTTSFNALQNAMEEASAERLAYFAFDLLHLDGFDLTGATLEERKAALADLLRRAGPAVEPMRFSDHVVGTGRQFFEQACRMKLEGIVSKKRGEPYRTGRGRGWLKVKCVAEQEFVIGGFTEPEGQRAGLGALLLGVNEDGGLRFAGKVGTGFTERMARELRQKLDALEVPAPPFSDKPTGVRLKGAHWVRPQLVAEVKFAEWTPDGRLRHPSFQGLREDKKPGEVVRETPAAEAEPAAPGTSAKKKAARRAAAPRKAASVRRRDATAIVAGVEITHADRLVYPDLGVSKQGLAEYYESIADWVLPDVVDRPTTLVRCPDGVSGPCFYQKHRGHWAPSALRRVKIQEKKKVGDYLVVDDLAGLVGLVQMGILEVHTWNSRAEHLEQPDRIVFDLDPAEGLPWPRVVDGARLVRDELLALKLRSFVKTTGGKGLHVVVPIARGPGWDECLGFSRALAERIAADRPREYVAEMSKSVRTGRIYLDYLRNLRGSTSIAAYSTRAKPGAPVSTPLHWDELDGRLRPERFTVTTMPERLRSLRADPWKGYDRLQQRLPPSADVQR
jgi:bifunctional non-homologous end joining protein LigD